MILRDWFDATDDDRAVLSVCAIADGTGWRLAHGSLLVVPKHCSQVGWAAWRRLNETGGPDVGPLPPEVCVSGDGWLLARTPMSVDGAEAWLDAVLTQLPPGDAYGPVVLPATAGLPSLSAELARAPGIIRVLPHTDAPASSLASSLSRPAQAMLLPAAANARVALPNTVDLHGTTTFLPARDIAGIHVATEGFRPTAAGLLVGRAERRAWIREGRGDGTWEFFLVHLGWDSALIDPADLEVTHEELLDGELVHSTRLRLEDLDLSAIAGKDACTVRLPSVGRRVAHGVTLSTVDGELIDRSGPYPLVERVEMTLVVDGHEMPAIRSGDDEPLPGIERRTDRTRQIAADMRAVLASAAAARVIEDRGDALARLAAHLAGVRGELLVMDAYFGQDVDDWRLLDDVPVGVRVLTAKIAEDLPAIAAHVDARVRPKAPLHERVWLWDGGGLSIGGSPSTFGQKLVRMSRIRASEVEVWRTTFEAQWSSDLFTDVPRAFDAAASP